MKLIKIMSLGLGLSIISACSKEGTSLNELTKGGPSKSSLPETVIDRDLINACEGSSVEFIFLAEKKGSPNFGKGWRWGTLDKLANNCVVGTLMPGWSSQNEEVFNDVPEFNFSNGFVFVTPDDQFQIIESALSYARSNCLCPPSSPIHINLIDFTQFPSGSFFGQQINFAVKYQCGPVHINE
jgi:hypothetical protein